MLLCDRIQQQKLFGARKDLVESLTLFSHLSCVRSKRTRASSPCEVGESLHKKRRANCLPRGGLHQVVSFLPSASHISVVPLGHYPLESSFGHSD